MLKSHQKSARVSQLKWFLILLVIVFLYHSCDYLHDELSFQYESTFSTFLCIPPLPLCIGPILGRDQRRLHPPAAKQQPYRLDDLPHLGGLPYNLAGAFAWLAWSWFSGENCKQSVPYFARCHISIICHLRQVSHIQRRPRWTILIAFFVTKASTFHCCLFFCSTGESTK